MGSSAYFIERKLIMKYDLITRFKKAITNIVNHEKDMWNCGMKNEYYRAEDIADKLIEILNEMGGGRK